MIRRPPRSTQSRSSAASDVYKRQVEVSSEHPLAAAIVAGARERNLPLAQATAFDSITGQGVRALVGGREILVGNRRLLTGAGIDPGPLDSDSQHLAADGKSPM